MLGECLVRRGPGVDPVPEREVVQAAEDSNRDVPADLADDRIGSRIVCEPPANVRVQP